jgi:hypothetical protein
MGLGLLSACYTYQPVEGPVPRTGVRVSADLTRDGTAAVVPLLGADVAEVEGTVVAASADTLRLSLASVTTSHGIPTSWRGEEVLLPRTGLTGLAERRISRGGTVLLGAGVLGGLYLLYRMLGGPGVFEGTAGSGGGGGR